MPKFIILNNVSSPQRLLDAVRTCYSLINSDEYVLVVTRATGMAAQVGIPEASKLAYRLGRVFLALPSLKDAVEVLGLRKLYVLVPNTVGEFTDLSAVSLEDREAFAICGTDDGFSRADLGLGTPVSASFIREYLPPASSIALIYLLSIKHQLR